MKNYQDKSWLKNKLIEYDRDPVRISKELNIKLYLLYKYIDKFKLEAIETYRDSKWLKENLKVKSAREIAKELGVSHGLILSYISEDLKPEEPWKDKNILTDLYVEKNLSLEEIGRKLGVSGKCIKYNIKKLKIVKPLKKYKNKEWLYNKYIKEDLSSEDIAKILDLKSHRVIQAYLQKFGIKKDSTISRINTMVSNGDIKIFDGQTIKQICDKRNIPHSTIYQNISKVYGSIDNISINELNKILDSHKNSETILEQFFSKEFNINIYNKQFDKNQYPDLKYRPDFKLNDMVAINVDGLYWHSEKCKPKYYHFNMRKKYEELGLRIFQFRRDEVYSKKNIIRSIINSSNNSIKDKIFARKCLIKDVSSQEAGVFLNNNHLMGYKKARHIGLYINNKLVSILSYKEYRQNKEVKIERFCSKTNTIVIGGLSKLISYLLKNNKSISKISSWVDLRYGNGNSLEKLGFEKVKDIVGWKWTDGYKTYNRLSCRANMDERKLSQKEYAKELGWYKIYDAGQRLYVKEV